MNAYPYWLKPRAPYCAEVISYDHVYYNIAFGHLVWEEIVPWMIATVIVSVEAFLVWNRESDPPSRGSLYITDAIMRPEDRYCIAGHGALAPIVIVQAVMGAISEIRNCAFMQQIQPLSQKEIDTPCRSRG